MLATSPACIRNTRANTAGSRNSMAPSLDPGMPDEGPAEQASDTSEGDTGQKVSQEQARYRKGSPVRCCGLCVHFEGAANGTCEVVDGEIVPYGVSDSFQIAKNPWGPMIGPQERA